MIEQGLNKNQEIFDRLISQEDVREVKLRDEVLSSINQYCSELSEELWLFYSNHMLPSLLHLEWTPELQQDFLVYQRLISKQGYERAGHLIMLQLKERLKDLDFDQKQ